jgi:hypothetical protein
LVLVYKQQLVAQHILEVLLPEVVEQEVTMVRVE